MEITSVVMCIDTPGKRGFKEFPSSGIFFLKENGIEKKASQGKR